MQPRYSILGHRENLFGSTEPLLQVIPFTDTRALERRMRAVAGQGGAAWRRSSRYDSGTSEPGAPYSTRQQS